MSWLRGIGLALGVVAFAAFAFGYVGFARLVENLRPPSPLPEADAIVALTGGKDRLSTGMQLLSEGRGRRMLVSGVNDAVSDKSVYALLDGPKDLIACCVDLGRAARTTLGNASETASWARRNGFARIIVVTDDFHIPRSVAELRAALPTAQLIAYPVQTPLSQHGAWWRDPGVAAQINSEYVKYLIIQARLAMLGSPAPRQEAPQA